MDPFGKDCDDGGEKNISSALSYLAHYERPSDRRKLIIAVPHSRYKEMFWRRIFCCCNSNDNPRPMRLTHTGRVPISYDGDAMVNELMRLIATRKLGDAQRVIDDAIVSGRKHDLREQIEDRSVLSHIVESWPTGNNATCRPFQEPLRSIVRQLLACGVSASDRPCGTGLLAQPFLYHNPETRNALILAGCVVDGPTLIESIRLYTASACDERVATDWFAHMLSLIDASYSFHSDITGRSATVAGHIASVECESSAIKPLLLTVCHSYAVQKTYRMLLESLLRVEPLAVLVLGYCGDDVVS